MYFAPYIDETGVHLPTYEDRLAKLLDDYRTIFGSDLVLTEDTQDYQFCSVFAKALDDLSSLMLESYAARDPDLASGQSLDLLLPLNNISRLPGETDTAARLRRSYAVSAPAQSTRESLLSAVLSAPNVTDAVLYENDTDETDASGVPAHSIWLIATGGYLTDVAKALYAQKPVGVSTYGTSSVTVTDEFGEDHVVKFSRPANKSLIVNVYLKTLQGFNETEMTAKIKTAIVNYVKTLKIGQDLLVPALYTPILSQDDQEHPTFIISSLTAGTGGSSSSLRITLNPNERFLISEGSVTVYPTPLI